MDGGASIVTFVTAGLQSIKIIHKACSTIKHWPGTVKAVSTQLGRLEGVLQRIVPEGDTVPAALQDLIRECTADLQRYAGRIQRLQAPDDASRGKKIWKRAKSVVDEGAIRRMAGALTEYGDQISLQLTLLQRFESLNLLLTGSIAHNADRDDLRESSRHVAAIANHQQDVAAGIQSTHGSIATLISTQETLNITLAAQTLTHSTALENVERVVREEATGLRQPIHDAISSLHTGSNAQFEEITAMLHEVQDFVKAQQPETSKGDEIHAVIDRLCRLIDAKPRTIASEEAEDVIDGIGTLLDLVHRPQSAQSKEHYKCYKGKQRDDEDIPTKDIKRIRGMLDSAPLVQIQQLVKKVRPPPGSTIKSNRRGKILELEYGTLTVGSTKRIRRKRNDEEDELNDFLFDMTFISKGRHRQAIFKASLYQRQLAQGSFTSIPNFVVYPVLPVGSPVFDVVRYGSVRDLEMLMWDGKASLRDRDEYGATLLHYAADALNVDMCRYLVNTGAEIDVLARRSGYMPLNDGLYLTPLQGRVFQLPSTNSADSICKTLLTAGADPSSFPGQPDFFGHFRNALDSANAERIRIALDYGSPYIDINTTDVNGLLPIHLLARCRMGSYNTETFGLLLQRGASVHARDLQGNTCLHHAVMNPLGNKTELDALIFLVQKGADMFATNYKGRSVSDVAYDSVTPDGMLQLDGSASGDLWDALLARCGYNVNEFRRGYPRKTEYRYAYTRGRFETLWEGFEAKCPYYDPWWDTHTYYAPGDDESMYQEVTTGWGQVYVTAKRPEDLEHTDSEEPIDESVEVELSEEAEDCVDQ